jgi:hypothetical protein
MSNLWIQCDEYSTSPHVHLRLAYTQSCWYRHDGDDNHALYGSNHISHASSVQLVYPSLGRSDAIIGAIASYLAVTRVQHISKPKLRFTIGTVILIAAIFASAQVYLLDEFLICLQGQFKGRIRNRFIRCGFT